MIIDGKKMAEEIKNSLREKILSFKTKPRLAIVKVDTSAVTEKFLNQKMKFTEDIGASFRIYDFPENVSTSQLRKKVSEIVHIEKNTGVIVQLPLPKSINTQYILDAIPPQKDPDVLSSKGFGLFSSGRLKVLPPVVGAIEHILMAYSVQLTAKNVVVFGAGRLVGKPVAVWLMNQGATVSVLNEYTLDAKRFTLDADIIISGVGKPGIIIPEMVKEGVIVIDCGTSIGGSDAKSERALLGDIDSEVAKKASIFTPTPGGVGPLTIAMLFSNLVQMAKRDNIRS